MQTELLILLGLVAVLFLCSNKNYENFSAAMPLGVQEVQRSYPMSTSRYTTGNHKQNTQNKPHKLTWETRFPGLVGQRYSYDDTVGQRTGCDHQCYSSTIGAELGELPLNLKRGSEFKAVVDKQLLEDYPLMNADAEFAKKETARLQTMDGGLFNIAKKRENSCVSGFSVGDSLLGRRSARNTQANTLFMAPVNI